MKNYLNKPTLAEKLAGYRESEDFKEAVAILGNDYRLEGLEIPPLADLEVQALHEKRVWLEALSACVAEGHQLTETADGENGTSDLSCDRCGFFQHIQW